MNSTIFLLTRVALMAATSRSVFESNVVGIGAAPHQFQTSFHACWEWFVGTSKEISGKFAVQLVSHNCILPFSTCLFVELIQQLLSHQPNNSCPISWYSAVVLFLSRIQEVPSFFMPEDARLALSEHNKLLDSL
jgi:hypothetical protein